MIKILLIDPPIEQIGFFNPYKKGPAFSLGLLSIDSYLRKNSYADVELDNYFSCDWNEIEVRFRRVNPDILGISCATDSRGFCWRLASLAKKINPKIKVVLGNVHATFFPKEMIKYHSVDFCVLGEGEETMFELVRALETNKTDYKNILGLAWRDSETGEIRINERRPFIQDLDSIPINSKHRLFINERGEHQGNIMSSRGCPFACAFCSSSTFWHRTWRKHSPERVVEEFNMLVNQGAEYIFIHDDLFTADIKRAEIICDALIQQGNKIPWYNQTRVDCINEKLIDKMIAAGCRKISFGVESGDPEIIKLVNKRIDLKKAIEVFDMLHKKKIFLQANFMIGNPGENPKTVEKSIQLAERLNPNSIIASIACVYPNTMLDQEAQRHGLIKPEYWVLGTARAPYYTVDMSYEDLQSLAIRMTFKWAANRGPIEFIKMVLSNWQMTGARRSVSFILGWIQRYFRGLIKINK